MHPISRQQRRPSSLGSASDRKWSDWSICSKECVRTRIRVNCDDLKGLRQLKSQQIPARNQTNPVTQEANKSILKKIKRQIEAKLAQLDNEQVKKEELDEDDEANNNEDEPSQDPDDEETGGQTEVTNSPGAHAELPEKPALSTPAEGDREDEEDPCFGLEQSLLIQSSPCVGGACLRSKLNQTSTDHRIKTSVGSNVRRRPEMVPVEPINEGYPHKGAPMASQETSGLNFIKQQERQVGRAWNQDQGNGNSTSIGQEVSHNENLTKQQQTLWARNLPDSVDSPSITSQLASGGNQKSSSSTGNDKNSSSGRALWPGQMLMGSDLAQSPAASLLQWTLVLGLMLALLLVIVLTIKRLFLAFYPSYHWLLARQAIKSSSQMAGAPSICACHHHSQASCTGPPMHSPNQHLVGKQEVYRNRDLSNNTQARFDQTHSYFDSWQQHQHQHDFRHHHHRQQQQRQHSHHFPALDQQQTKCSLFVDSKGNTHLLSNNHADQNQLFERELNGSEQAIDLDPGSWVGTSRANNQMDSQGWTTKSLGSTTYAIPDDALLVGPNAGSSLVICPNETEVRRLSNTRIIQATSKQEAGPGKTELTESVSSIESSTAEMISNDDGLSSTEHPDLAVELVRVLGPEPARSAAIKESSRTRPSMDPNLRPRTKNHVKVKPKLGSPLTKRLDAISSQAQSQPNSPMFANIQSRVARYEASRSARPSDLSSSAQNCTITSSAKEMARDVQSEETNQQDDDSAKHYYEEIYKADEN